MAISRRRGERTGETTEVGEDGEENPAFGEAGRRFKVRETPERMTALLGFPFR